MIELIFATLLQATVGDPQVSETPPTEQVQQQAQAADDSQRVRCRTRPRPNSRFGQRVCLTGEQWEERAEAARRDFSDTQNRPHINVEPEEVGLPR